MAIIKYSTGTVKKVLDPVPEEDKKYIEEKLSEAVDGKTEMEKTASDENKRPCWAEESD